MCILNKKPQLGILKYIGKAHFADGEWCGILLDEACGKNDGSVKGVRYFRCKNKHGIFVHSHKVKAADDITLSRLNLLESPCSPQSAEKKNRTGVNSGQRMSSSDVEIVRSDHMAFKHRDVKSLRLTRRNRSVSLDRYLFLKAKQLAKGFNILLHNAEKDGKISTWEQNRLNRCRSLPKITKENLCDSNEYCLNSEMVPLEKNVCQGDRMSSGEKVLYNDLYNNPTKVAGVLSSAEGVINNLSKENQQTFSDDSPSVNSLNRPDSLHTSQNTTNGGTTAVHKVGHAVSLDSHLMIKKGQLPISNGNDDDISCVSHLANKEDPFIQGRHCSCPSLHCADHFSESITTCLDLGRTERSVIPEAEDDLESAHSHETHHKPLGYSHSQSETLEKIFWKTEVVRSKSSCSREAELTRTGSWPWLTSSPKQSLRRYSSSSNIDWCGAPGRSGDFEDVFDDRLTTLFTPIKPISDDTAERCLDLKNVDIVPQAADHTVNNVGKSLPKESHGHVDGDSNYSDSLSGSQASLSSTGTSESKGKKTSTTKRISGSVKSGSGAKSKTIPIRNNNVSKPPPQQKQSRLEQMRQQHNCRVSSSSSTGNKSQLPKTAAASTAGNNEVKMQKRHTLGTLPDVKSFVPQPSISKRPLSGGITEQSAKDKAKSSNLPVKKMATPSQISKPPTLPKLDKKSEAASIQRRHSSAASRQPVAPVVKRDSGLVRSDSKARKISRSATIPAKASTGKEKETSVVGQKVVGGQNSTAIKGPKGSAAASGSKPQTSRVTKSSSSIRGNGNFFMSL